MNRCKINVGAFTSLLELYKCKDGTLTVHMIEKILYHLANHGDVESVEHGLE